MKTIRLSYRRDVIRALPKRYADQYPDDEKPSGWSKGTVGDVKKALAALNLERATVKEVIACGVHDSWLRHECDLCERDHDVLVCIGDVDGGYETRWVAICTDHAAEAWRLVHAATDGASRFPT